MPLWEKMLVLFIISISITSLYAVVYNYMGVHQNDNSTVPGIKGLLSRIEWGAQPPVFAPVALANRPIPYVIIAHTATSFCYSRPRCILIVRIAQAFHIESKGWNDIAYNFLIGGDGNIYEGRGWETEGAHTFGYNNRSIGIAFIGTFSNAHPTASQIDAGQKLINYGVETGKLTQDYKLLGHRQCTTTVSPGQVLYDIIKTWEHWSPTP